MQKAKVLSYIGLATRARKSVSGEFSVENSVRKGKAKLVVVSEEASENTKKKIRSLCEYYKVPLYVAYSSAELGSACGKEFRMSVAVEDEGRCGDPGIRVNTGNGGIGNHAKQAYQSL